MSNDLKFLDVNPEQQIRELERELATRVRVYPRWIQQGKIKERDAQLRLSALEASIHALRVHYSERRDGLGIPQAKAASGLRSAMKLKLHWVFASNWMIENNYWSPSEATEAKSVLDDFIGFLRNVKYGSAVMGNKSMEGNLFNQ
jgi:hypothetical protein